MPASGGAVRRGQGERDPLACWLSGGGAIAAKPMGGDRHSHRTEAHAALILQTLEDRSQVYLREVRDALADHGAAVSLSGLSRFFRRRGISRKKGRSTRASRTART